MRIKIYYSTEDHIPLCFKHATLEAIKGKDVKTHEGDGYITDCEICEEE